ncbi:aminotransferase class V-fold PLP-dependent enzyme [Ochrobactrum cytisi]|nr:aminotransferase class V-fold PLP-dependent enzyme [Brucella cytisi]
MSFGGNIDQAIRLTGATVVQAGTVSITHDYHLANAITERTAAALLCRFAPYRAVWSVTPEQFVEICHSGDVPVIVDAASEYDLQGFLKAGADVVIYSGHKFLGGPTSGIVAGRKDLVRAAFLQNRGIGRGMKVGKESIAGVIAALEAWENRDHVGIRKGEKEALKLWQDSLARRNGIITEIVPDPTGNPLERLEIRVKPASGFTASGRQKRWHLPSHRSLYAIMRSSSVAFFWTPAICMKAKRRSWLKYCLRY